ncbi:MAG: hypothetical protein H0X33_03755 [Taibaiella sp.]|nr:hypothetical protein [Taibaiella sp.]
MKKVLINSMIIWLPLSAAITLSFAVLYLTLQQNIRMAANDLPYHEALDVRNSLVKGGTPQQVIAPYKQLNLSSSHSAFVIIADQQGTVASSATLSGHAPLIPSDALQNAGENGINSITWQPANGIRNAIVILPYATAGGRGYVIAGQSLIEGEKRMTILSTIIFTGLVLISIVSLVITILFQYCKIIRVV